MTTAVHAQSNASPTVASIREAHTLTCGIDQSEAEYSMDDQHGARFAFDTDLCRAVAVAILGPKAQIAVKGYPDNQTALTALAHHEVDLVPTVSADFTDSAQPGIALTQPVLHDAQGFMVPRSAHITSPAQLSHKKVCFLDETELETSLRTYFADHHLNFVPFPFQEEGEMEAAFVTNNCTAMSSTLTRLAETRIEFATKAKDYDILPTTIAPDPLAMAYRADDPAFGRILTWTFNLLLNAEDRNVTRQTAATLSNTPDPTLRRLLGLTHELGAPLGLADDWPENVLAATGNFAEIYNRDLGSGSPMKLRRGQNALAKDGGLLQPLPLK
ncbi:MAG: transporter substrate-binding domain-containing protein [Acidobacteriota bacterium]